MKSARRNLVYYTLYLTDTARSYHSLVEQHLASVESLRKNNRSVPVCLTICGNELRKRDQRHLNNLGVRVRYLGSYEERLKRSGFEFLAKVFAENPNSPRWVTLPGILNFRFDRVLCIDNDVFFIRDVEEIFAALESSDVCAREEPWTKPSPLGYDPGYLDAIVMRRLQRSEKLYQIIPFNTGVLLMKRPVAEWFCANLHLYLIYLIRFTIWMAKRRPSPDDQAFVVIARELGIDEAKTSLGPLHYPCSNQWIIGQLALWFTFAARKFNIRFFPRSLVLQGSEFLAIGRQLQTPALVHYYSANSDYFFRWLRRFL